MKAIINGLIYKDYRLLKNKVLVYDEKIIGIMNHEEMDSRQYDEIINAQGRWILPGFIDVHIHGYGGYDTMDASEISLNKISEGIAENGVTAFLPTTMTMSTEHIQSALTHIQQGMKTCKGARILGAHLEGPFISPAFKGAQSDTYITNPNLELIGEHKDLIKIITLAPETPGAMNFIETVTEQGIQVSLGHTAADFETAHEAYLKGARSITHLFSAMTGMHHRKPGCVGAALIDDFYCELIADNFHIHPNMYNLILKTKKPDQILLVTDCMRAGGMAEGAYDLGGQKVTVTEGKCLLENGTIAGSTLKLNQGLFNFMAQTGLPIEEAVRFITENPAKYLGVDHLYGSLDEGKYADFTITDTQLNIYMTIREGEAIYEKKD